MKKYTTVQKELDKLKNDVIGLFKMRNSNVFELIINVKEFATLDVIRITQFGAIQQEFNLPIHYGTFKLFPDNKNMNQMLDNPFEFDIFVESFK